MQCTLCPSLQKKMRIMKSDYEFQIKKIQQDKSSEKAMYEIHLQKQIRRWQQLYQREKIQREDETKNWMKKYDSTVINFTAQIQQLKQTNQKNLQNKMDFLSNKLNSQITKLTTQYQQKIQNQNKKYNEQIATMIQMHSSKISEIELNSQNCIANLKKSNKLQIEQKIRFYESKILGLQSEYSKQKKLHQATKEQSKDAQSKLYKQIFELRRNISQLQTRSSQQLKDSKSKQQTIDQLNAAINNLKISHQTEIEKVKMNSQQALEECRQDYRIKLSQMYKDTLTYCNKYQQAISKIQETRQSQRGIYLNNIQQINQFVQNRASRLEDIEQIQLLRHSLAKKSRECDGLAEQIKLFRLELENKQETYNKIFVPLLNPANQNMIYKRKQFKLRRQGRSVTTVREALQTLNSANIQKKVGTPYLSNKPKIL